MIHVPDVYAVATILAKPKAPIASADSMIEFLLVTSLSIAVTRNGSTYGTPNV
jgi:hypothetical protein